jgi:hypothetical protein
MPRTKQNDILPLPSTLIRTFDGENYARKIGLSIWGTRKGNLFYLIFELAMFHSGKHFPTLPAAFWVDRSTIISGRRHDKWN